jgi:hypothetical protein
MNIWCRIFYAAPPTYEECQRKEIFAAVPEVIRISTEATGYTYSYVACNI